MKKIVLTVFVIALTAVLGLTLIACNNATTQGQLANILDDHHTERFVYDVVENTSGVDVHGTYTVDLLAVSAGTDLEFGSATLPKVERGVLVKAKREIGNSVVETGCYYNLIKNSSFMVPFATYRIEKTGGDTTFNLQGSYDGSKLNYTLTAQKTSNTSTLSSIDGLQIQNANGISKTGTLSAKGLLYDNNQFHQTLRCVTTLSDSFSFSFSVPSFTVDEQAIASLTAQVTAKEKVKTAYTDTYLKDGEFIYKEEGIECYRMTLSRSTQVSGIGLSQTLYYASSDVLLNGWALKNVLVKFVEPASKTTQFVYTLKDASLS